MIRKMPKISQLRAVQGVFFIGGEIIVRMTITVIVIIYVSTDVYDSEYPY